MADEPVQSHPTAYEGPHAHLHKMYGDRWYYRWWDDGYAYLRGQPPTREGTIQSLQAALPMLLSDHSRQVLSAELRGSPPAT